MDKSKNRIGEIGFNNFGSRMTIIEYNTLITYKVEIDD